MLNFPLRCHHAGGAHEHAQDLLDELREDLPLCLAKAERKGRSKSEVDQIIQWLTGYDQAGIEANVADQTDLETFFSKCPEPNPKRSLIQGVVCGVRVEDIEEETMREIRTLDKLIDELARGKTMDKILRA